MRALISVIPLVLMKLNVLFINDQKQHLVKTMINKLAVLFSFLLLNGCMYDQFAQKTHFDLYRNSDGSYSFNLFAAKKIRARFEMRQNKIGHQLIDNVEIIKLLIKDLNYFIINGICLK